MSLATVQSSKFKVQGAERWFKALRDGSKFKVQGAGRQVLSPLRYESGKAERKARGAGCQVLSPLRYESEPTGGKLDGVQ